MKYCSRCKRLFADDTDTCQCGRKLTNKVQSDTPILLIAADGVEKDRLSALLDDEKLPYSVQIKEEPGNVTSVPGFETAEYNIYVPFGFYKRSIDALSGAVSMQLPEYYDSLPDGESSEWTEMSPTKRNIIRLLSAIAFAAVVWLVVTGVDVIAAFITGLFR